MGVALGGIESFSDGAGEGLNDTLGLSLVAASSPKKGGKLDKLSTAGVALGE